MICDECKTLFDEVGNRVREHHVFDGVSRSDKALLCRARDVESDTFYRVEPDAANKRVWVGLFTPDRWLSGSIETQLVHQGDKLEDLLEEELVDQGYEGRLPMEHFRNDDKEYVFRSPVALGTSESFNSPGMIDRVTRILLAYEAMFRQLGDMAPGEDDE